MTSITTDLTLKYKAGLLTKQETIDRLVILRRELDGTKYHTEVNAVIWKLENTY